MFILIIHKARMKILLPSAVIIPVEKVYAYDPVPKELNEEQGKHITRCTGKYMDRIHEEYTER